MSKVDTTADEMLILTGKQALIIHKQEVALNQLTEMYNQKVQELDLANKHIEDLKKAIEHEQSIGKVVDGIFSDKEKPVN